jgi:NADH-quinone oxidoreductase subunit L
VALLASLLTAFYMFRLYFLTFGGKVRADHHTMEHIHESPKSITVPLIILAILSAVGGFLGFPEVFGGSNRLGEFLAPVFATSTRLAEHHALSHATELGLMGLVVGATLVLIIVAYIIYVSKNAVPVSEESAMGGLQRLLYNKYYIDELYDTLIVKPLYWISGVLESVVERLGIDRLVNAVGGGVVAASRGARLLQPGNIGFYIFVMVIGVVLLLVAAVVR